MTRIPDGEEVIVCRGEDSFRKTSVLYQPCPNCFDVRGFLERGCWEENILVLGNVGLGSELWED